MTDDPASGSVAPAATSRAGSRGRGTGLLDPSFLARLEQLQLKTRRRLAGQFTGEHRSSRYGSSLDFADYREYHPGDDFRRIDYLLLARLDVLLIKLFEAEDDITVRILVDTSASMGMGGKLEQAARLAGALGFVSLVRRDAVTIHTFPLEKAAPRFIGRGAVTPMFRMLESLTAAGDTRFADAAGHLLARPGKPGVTIVISDLLTPDWERGIKRLPARGGDVIVVHVLDREDVHPTNIGDFDLVDRESGARMPVSLSPESVRQYEQLAEKWIEEVAGRCHQAGAAYVRLWSDDPIEEILLRSWRHEGLVR